MSENWYFQLFGDQFGPVSRDELTQLAQIGKLSSDDPVRAEGEADWQPAENVIDFSQIEQERLESGVIPMSTTMDWEDGANRSRPSSPVQVPESSGDSLPSLDDIIIGREDDSHRQAISLDHFLEQHGPASSTAGAEEDDHFELADGLADKLVDSWFLRSLGDESGPYSPLEVQMKIRRGEIDRNDFLRRGSSGAWQRAERVDEFRFPTTPPINTTAPKLTITDGADEPDVNESAVEAADSAASPEETGRGKEAKKLDRKKNSREAKKAAALEAYFAKHGLDDEEPEETTQPAVIPAETTSTPVAASTQPKPQVASLPKPAVPPRNRKKSGSSLQFDFDFGALKEGTGRNVLIAVAVVALLVTGYFFNPFKSGGRQLTAAEQLWAEVQNRQNDPGFSSEATAVYLPQAQELFETLKPIPNTKNKVIARVKTAVKDGLIPYLAQYPKYNDEGTKTVNYHLNAAREVYESGNY